MSGEVPDAVAEDYTHALAAGQTYLRITPGAQLLALADPFDPAKREGAVGLPGASLYHRRYYLYFGITPFATLLVPVLRATGRQISDIDAIVGYAIGATLILSLVFRDAARRYYPAAGPLALFAVLFAAGTASGGLMLARIPNLNELVAAAAWFHGVAALGCGYAALHRNGRARTAWLALAGLNAGLVVGARPDQVGIAAATAGFILFLACAAPGTRAARWGRAGVALLPLAAVALALAWFNWIRFGSPLEFGFRYQLVPFDQSHGGFLSLRYAPYNAWYYVLGRSLSSGWFPYFEWPAPAPFPPARAYFDVDQVFGLLVTCPLAFFGALVLIRRRAAGRGALTPFLLLVGACGLLNLLFLSILNSAVYRYAADFRPYAALAGGLGLLALAGAGNWIRRGLYGLGVGVAVFSALASFCEAVSLFDQTRDSNPDTFARLSRIFDAPRLEFERWRRTPLQEFKVRALLPSDKFGTDEPLLVTGHAGVQDFIYFYYAGPGLLRIGFEAIGRGGPVSGFIPVDYSRPLDLEIAMGNRWPPPGAWIYDGLAPELAQEAPAEAADQGQRQDRHRRLRRLSPEQGTLFLGPEPERSRFRSRFLGEAAGNFRGAPGGGRERRPGEAGPLGREGLVDQLAEVVDEEEVGLLGGGAALSRDDQLAGGEALGLAAAAAKEGEAGDAELLRLLEGGDDVGGVAARSDDDHEVARPGQAGDLAREDLFVAKIVADAGQERAVRGKGDRGQGPAGLGVAAHELRREVRRLGRAAAVPADQQLAAAAQRLEDQLAGPVDGRPDLGQRLQRARGLGERIVEGHGPTKDGCTLARDNNFYGSGPCPECPSGRCGKPSWRESRSRRAAPRAPWASS